MKNKDNILVIIAARDGSKGVKNKNIRPLMNKPLIAYSIRQALKWGRAQNIVCSTDSRKIARIARRYGAEVPFIRPKRLAGDNAAKVPVLRHALLTCERLYNKVYDVIVDLDVTAPVRKVSDLGRCLKLFKKRKPKTLFSAVRSRKNPYYNMVEEKKGGRAALCKVSGRPIFARQKAPLVYDMNASICFFRRDYLINKKNLSSISDNSVVYVMDNISGVDIDSEIDFRFVEFLLKEGIWKSEV